MAGQKALLWKDMTRRSEYIALGWLSLWCTKVIAIKCMYEIYEDGHNKLQYPSQRLSYISIG